MPWPRFRPAGHSCVSERTVAILPPPACFPPDEGWAPAGSEGLGARTGWPASPQATCPSSASLGLRLEPGAGRWIIATLSNAFVQYGKLANYALNSYQPGNPCAGRRLCRPDSGGMTLFPMALFLPSPLVGEGPTPDVIRDARRADEGLFPDDSHRP